MRKNFSKDMVITPLPVLIIGTYDKNGVPNAMNAAWGTQCDYSQIIITLSKHKTTDNLKVKKAFTVSFATPETMEISDYFGIESGNNVNKIEKAGVKVIKSEFVDAPIIENYPLTLECEVAEMQEIDGEYRVIGNIVNMSVDESILTDGKVDLGKLKPISFDSASNSYRVLGDVVGKAFHDGLKIKNKK